MAQIYVLKDADPDIKKVAEYNLPPRMALVCYIKQQLLGDYNTANYPDLISGMRESDTLSDHWYFDDNISKDPGVIAAYPY